MAAHLTIPTNSLNFKIGGDLDIYNALSADNGDGSVYVRNGGLYVSGLTDLDQTTVNTNNGEFNISGTNKVNVNLSGGATSSVEITAEDPSFFTTTTGSLTLSATATDSNGKIIVRGAGTGTNSVLIDAPNATSGQVTIQSAGGSVSTSAIQLLASDTTDGDILLQGSGNFASSNPAVKLYASNATSGQISLVSAGDSASNDAINLKATGTTGGNIYLTAAGSTVPAIDIEATDAAGVVHIHTAGTAAGSIHIDTSGGILTESAGLTSIQSSDTANGVHIGTVTAGVPVTLGTSTSLTTISGDLTVQGTFATINTETLTVADNVIIINSGNGELGLDSGLAVRRYQLPNDTSIGDVVTNPNPVQESGAFQTGSATPATLKLSLYASSTTDFYKGWWVLVTSGTGSGEARRIKSYNGTTKVATTYATADNIVGPPAFTDGLDLTNAPAAADTYKLYSASYIASFYGETDDFWTFASIANAPDPVSAVGISHATVQQYQNFNSGAHYIHDKFYDNVRITASTTTITAYLIGHTSVAGDQIIVTNSSGLTPSINATYVIASTPTADTFTFIAAASTTGTTAASATITLMNTSVLKVNVIEPLDPTFSGIAIPGLTSTEDIAIPRTSTADFTVTTSALYGCYLMLVADLNNTDGSFGVFSLASSGLGGSFSRISGSKASFNARIDCSWTSGNKITIHQSPAGSAGAVITYRVRLIKVL